MCIHICVYACQGRRSAGCFAEGGAKHMVSLFKDLWNPFVCVYLYVCVYICVYMNIYIHLYTPIFLCVYTYIYTYLYVHMFIYID